MEDGARLGVRADVEVRDDLALLADGVGHRSVGHLLVRDGPHAPLRVEQIEDEVIRLRHHPAVAGVGDLEGTLLLHRCARLPREGTGHERVDVRDADFEQRREVGLAVRLRAAEVALGLHCALVEGVPECGIERGVGRPVRVDRAHRLDEHPHAGLCDPRRIPQEPHRERGVAVDVVDEYRVPLGVESEEQRVHHLLARRPRHETQAVVVVVERETLALHVDVRPLTVPVEREALSGEGLETDDEAAIDLDFHVSSSTALSQRRWLMRVVSSSFVLRIPPLDRTKMHHKPHLTPSYEMQGWDEG